MLKTNNNNNNNNNNINSKNDEEIKQHFYSYGIEFIENAGFLKWLD